MYLKIPKDMFDNPTPPRLFLCNTGKKIIGELPSYDCQLDAKWNAYSELSFSIDRQYTDVLTGETKVHPLFDKAEGLRKVYAENIGYFIIQDPDTLYADKDSKTLSCMSTEYETASKYLENFYVNTGEVDSKEVIYLASIYGENYIIDTPYTLAISGEYDEYESYYTKEYSDTDSYVYEQIQIADESSYQTHFDNGSNAGIPLYIKKYPNVRFYYPTKPELSLLHLIFEKIPEWSIGNVDVSLWRKERKFDEERIAVYDFLMNEISETFKCVVEWDTIHNKVNFYEEAEDGINEDNTIQTRFETDVFISRENLANEINIKYSADDIKTKLKVSGSDDLNIREVNLGKNYILNLDYFHTTDWMEQDLFEAYQKYLDTCEEYTSQYTEATQGWVSAYNHWNDLMNAVPAQGGVVRVGDKFEKLYCVYSPIDTAYLPYTLTNSDINGVVDNLYSDKECKDAINKELLEDNETFTVQGYVYIYQSDDNNFKCNRNSTLNKLSAMEGNLTDLYSINEDVDANIADNVLLILRNSDTDTATIRIYNNGSKDSPEYMIQSIIVRATSGLTDTPSTYTMNQWIRGELTAEKMDLEGFTVSYIGTMGAYLVLAKNEKEKVNLEDYGVYLLREKQETYIKIFQTQTEAMFSNEKYQCTASDETPIGNIEEGTRWLDTDSSPVKLYAYTGGKWIEINNNLKDHTNYARYKENYDKLIAVQEVLIEKETEAEYILNGYAVTTQKIDLSKYQLDDDGVLRYNGQSLEGDMQRVAETHFKGEEVTRWTGGNALNQNIPLYFFTTTKYPSDVFAVYLKDTTPYVAYKESRGVYQSIRDYITQKTDFENFFTDDQWARLSPLIREDEFSDDNFLLTGYESEEERIKICEELMETAAKELKTLSQPSLEFSMDMANILALPEFLSLINQFQLGNFIRVGMREDYVKRARLLEVHLSFDDLSDFNADFGNLVSTRSEIDKHAELLKQAVTAGKQVATSAGEWQRAVDKSNKLEEAISNGLQEAALEIGKANGQSITWNEQGIRCRKLIDGTTDQYEDAQIAIINNKIVFTNDGWETSKAALGEFTIELDGVNQSMYGLLADAVVSGYISGSIIKGGELEIGGEGGTFRVNPDGSVEILAADNSSVYASKKDMDLVSQARQYYTEIIYNGSTVFSEPNSSCTITCKVYNWEEDITERIKNIGGTFSWIRSSSTDDTKWNNDHSNSTLNTITITNEDIVKNAQFSCEVNFDTDKL